MKQIIFIIFSFFSSIIFGQKIYKNSDFYTDSIYSNFLKEYRHHNIYLPKGYIPNEQYKIIYATDGKRINDNHKIKTILDSLINNKIIEPIIYVESFPNLKIVDSIKFSDNEIDYITLRNYEYVENFSNYSNNENLKNRFKNHFEYFKNELIPSIESKLKIQDDKVSHRIYLGFSNGAGFGINFINKEPKIFKTCISISPLGSNYKNLFWQNGSQYPEIYIEYGKDEEDFMQTEFQNLLESLNVNKISYNTYEGKHEEIYWTKELKKLLPNVLNE